MENFNFLPKFHCFPAARNFQKAQHTAPKQKMPDLNGEHSFHSTATWPPYHEAKYFKEHTGGVEEGEMGRCCKYKHALPHSLQADSKPLFLQEQLALLTSIRFSFISHYTP